MLVALDEQNKRIVSWEAQRGIAYICPSCHLPVVLKQGQRVIAHFAHHPLAACWVASQPESAIHLKMKQDMYQLFKLEPWVRRIDLEQVIGQRRADVWLDTAVGPIAVECQVSSLTVEELADKLQDYTDRGIASLYIVHESVLAALIEGAEVRVPAWVLALHALYRGRVYVYQLDGLIVPVHFEAVLRQPSGYGVRVRRLKATRRVMRGSGIRDVELRSSLIGCQYGLLAGRMYAVALFGDGMFWS